MAGIFRRSFLGKSLRWQIGLLYTLLAVLNIIFFSVMIFENQSDLLLVNFRYQSESLVNSVISGLEGLELSKDEDANYVGFQKAMQLNNITAFVLFDADGVVWHQYPEADRKGSINGELKSKAVQLGSSASVFKTKYLISFNEQDYSVNFTLPLHAKNNMTIYMNTSLSMAAIRERLNRLYYQMGIAVVYGIVFHLLFALFLFRVIFTRVGLLKEASNRMAGGELGARAVWEQRGNDELDELGSAFNFMAGKIEDTVATISKLNEEIQSELRIGKEVQELFLPPLTKLKQINASIYYRPLREVSGDVYAVYEFPGGHRAIFFADASGHGVSAALITTITLLSLDEVLRKTINPREVITRLNQTLSDRLQSSFFATAFFLLVDNKGDAFYCNAGHNPPLWIRPGGSNVVQLEKSGPPLGLMDGFEYPGKYLRLLKNDRIFIYSDGLIETRNADGKEFTLERAEQLLVQNLRLPDTESLTILKNNLEEHAFEYKDDVSAILMEVP